jgi:hypothetical protein
MSQIWGDEHLIPNPPLHIVVNAFRPVPAQKWKRLAETDTDLVITYHAEGIAESLGTVLGRPYKFIHIVRDPIEQLVSAYFYETQREGTGVHDKYFKIVHNAATPEEGILGLAKYMRVELETMETQFLQTEHDSNALNMKLEDFLIDFQDSAMRMFSFLGVPESFHGVFLKHAHREDLSSKTKEQLEFNEHISIGKHDKEPLRVILRNHPVFGPRLAKMRATLGYTDAPNKPLQAGPLGAVAKAPISWSSESISEGEIVGDSNHTLSGVLGTKGSTSHTFHHPRTDGRRTTPHVHKRKSGGLFKTLFGA